MKLIIPAKVNDICSRLEILLGLGRSGHTDEASNIIDEKKRGKTQNEQQNQNAHGKFCTF